MGTPGILRGQKIVDPTGLRQQGQGLSLSSNVNTRAQVNPNDQVSYYDSLGKPYNRASGGNSYWFNKADNAYYQGTPQGQISNVGPNAPWAPKETSPSVPPVDPSRITSTNAPPRAGDGTPSAATSGPGMNSYLANILKWYDENNNINDLASKQKSALTEQLRGAQSTDRQRMADILGGQGIGGGQAQDQLGSLDRNYALGLSQGLSGIEQNAATNLATQKGDLLKGALQLEDMNKGYSVKEQQLALDKMLGMGTLDLSWFKAKSDAELSSKQLALTQAYQNGSLSAQMYQNYISMLNNQNNFNLQNKSLDMGMITQLMQFTGNDIQKAIDLYKYMTGIDTATGGV
jgi:hypothetical protein